MGEKNDAGVSAPVESDGDVDDDEWTLNGDVKLPSTRLLWRSMYWRQSFDWNDIRAGYADRPIIEYSPKKTWQIGAWMMQIGLLASHIFIFSHRLQPFGYVRENKEGFRRHLLEGAVTGLLIHYLWSNLICLAAAHVSYDWIFFLFGFHEHMQTAVRNMAAWLPTPNVDWGWFFFANLGCL